MGGQTPDLPLPGDPPYAEVPPPQALADCVLSLWEMRIPSLPLPTRARIMPNACVDIVMYLSDTSQGEGAASVVGPPHRSFIVGSTLRSFIMRSAGWRHIIGASLRPAGVLPLLGLPASEIGEALAALHDVIGARASQIEDHVFDGPGTGALRRLGEALMRLRRPSEAAGDVAQRADLLVRRAYGRRRIDALAGDLNVSGRRLERRFLAELGITPKLFSRLVRFDRMVRDLARRGTTPWSRFALEHGYTDQAHFINEFREFAGLTPSEYEAETKEQPPTTGPLPDG